MSGRQPRTNEIDRQLPVGDEIFLDHVAHFVRDARSRKPRARALRLCADAGLDPGQSRSGRRRAPDRDRQCHRDVVARLCRNAVQDLRHAAEPRIRCGARAPRRDCISPPLPSPMREGAPAARRRTVLRVRDLVHMSAPGRDRTGPGTAAFTIARVEPGAMPEGRIQMLTHHTEETVWQERWLTHPNSAIGLIDVVIAVADVEEAAAAICAFYRPRGNADTRRRAACASIAAACISSAMTGRSERLPEVAITTLPFMLGYALRVESLAAAEMAVDGAGPGMACLRRRHRRRLPRRARRGRVVLCRARGRAAVAAVKAIRPELSRPRPGRLP